MNNRRLWITLAIVIVVSFAALGGVGKQMIDNAPPVPGMVVTADGRALFDGDTIRNGQNVWQSLGGQEVGSIWGHGAYVAPDWTADWLHRESLYILNSWARSSGVRDYAALNLEQQAALRARLRQTMRANSYNSSTRRITIPSVRAAAFDKLAAYYADLFSTGRNEYAIPRGALEDPVKQREMAAFFWWTAWAATTERPGSTVTYTNNWPSEPLVGNSPPPSALVWSVISFVLLLAGIGGMVWCFASTEREPAHEPLPERDPLLGLHPTASQRATLK